MTEPRTRVNDPVARFAEVAERFRAWAESPPEVPEWEADTAIRFLLELVARALDLPEVDLGDDEEVDEDVRPDHAGYVAMRARFAVLPVGLYATIDPEDLAGETHLTGDVLDDLADVWRDVREGLALHRAGRVDEACWTWRFSFRNHWGTRAAEAMRVLMAHRSRA